MVIRIIGIILAVLGLIVNFAYKFILEKLFHITDIQEKDILKVKVAGLVLALIGAAVVFIFG